MSSFRRLMHFLSPYKLQLVFGFLAVVVTTLSGLSVPLILKYLLDMVFAARNAAEATHHLNRLVMIFAGLYGARWVFQYFTTFLVSSAGYGMVRDLRSATYVHLMRLSLSYYETRATGDIMSRVTSDVSTIQNGISTSILDFGQSALTIVGVVAAVLVLNWKLALLTVFIIPSLGVLVGRFGDRIRRIGREAQAKLGDLTSILQETLSGILVVKAFTTESREIARFESHNAANLSANLRSARLLAVLYPAVEAVLAVGIILVIFVGGKAVVSGDMTSGDLIAFLSYLAMAATPASSIARAYTAMQTSLGAAERVFELLDTQVSVEERPDAREVTSPRGRVVFDHVSFEYRAGQRVLDELCLTAEPGEIVAIVGPSGAGKSSLVNLVARFYDVTGGRVLLDGRDIRDLKVKGLRGIVGMVPQDSLLFSTTLKDNISYGNPGASVEEVVEAAKAANAHGFIQDLPQGYDTVVGERGATLSGGQRQRVAIARAILRDPRILILDEATSALDTESETLVQEALDRLMKGRTTFVIAHRLSTVRNASRIVVIESGRVTESGTHDELLALGHSYARLYQAQFAGGIV